VNPSGGTSAVRAVLTTVTSDEDQLTFARTPDNVRQRRWRLVARPERVAELRVEVTVVLALWKQERFTEGVCLCLAELLANVIKHVDNPGCVLSLQDLGAGVRLTVSDGDRLLPVIREADPFAESGRGMHLIAATASVIGSALTATGKDVWAEFRAVGDDS
jgi:hypothetical protein